MKYYKLDYDMNTPSVRQVSVPDNSDYGVAVKVFKDGKRVDAQLGEIMIGETSATSTTDGYSLFDLESGGCGIQESKVSIDKDDTIDITYDYLGEFTNALPNATNKNIQFNVSEIFDEPPTLDAGWISLVSLEYRTGPKDGDYGEWKTETPNETNGSVPRKQVAFYKTGYISNSLPLFAV